MFGAIETMLLNLVDKTSIILLYGNVSLLGDIFFEKNILYDGPHALKGKFRTPLPLTHTNPYYIGYVELLF